MVVLKLLEGAFAAAVILFVVSQVGLPLLQGKPLFPILRGGQVNRLEDERVEAEEDLSASKLERDVQRVKERADQVRHRSTGKNPGSSGE